MPVTFPEPATSALHVRPAEDADLPALRRIAEQSLDLEPVDPAGVVDLLHFRPGGSRALRLTATWRAEVAGFCYASVSGLIGSLDGLAVAAAVRRHGIATALVTEACRRLAEAGCETVRTAGSTWHYAWPGIDEGYAAAQMLALRCGFRRQEVAHNMDVDLAGWPSRRNHLAASRGPRQPVEIRRARAEDVGAVRGLVREDFEPCWAHEMTIALSRPFPTAFVAERAGRLVGFAGYAVYRPDLFGPLGTVPDERGNGTGRALLMACLDDMAAAGLAVAQINWVGPVEFYERAVGARIGRTFVVFGKSLDAPGSAPVPRR